MATRSRSTQSLRWEHADDELQYRPALWQKPHVSPCGRFDGASMGADMCLRPCTWKSRRHNALPALFALQGSPRTSRLSDVAPRSYRTPDGVIYSLATSTPESWALSMRVGRIFMRVGPRFLFAWDVVHVAWGALQHYTGRAA
ncbi:hypothetical protein JG688_00004445 [Phytophthora aleatoria]|uniref:Uncharacterized protein n=1 Tax=Phytophthora aleatoria TaxID=2496075 RepID=A0A8J5M799_9STRA|nr:hypothetical protein JG688_00004445 [Phytophthora aleatoria]